MDCPDHPIVEEKEINSFNRDYALDFLLQGRIASNTGTSSIFDARHDGDHVCALKNLWSTRLYCTSAFHDETLMNNPGSTRVASILQKIRTKYQNTKKKFFEKIRPSVQLHNSTLQYPKSLGDDFSTCWKKPLMHNYTFNHILLPFYAMRIIDSYPGFSGKPQHHTKHHHPHRCTQRRRSAKSMEEFITPLLHAMARGASVISALNHLPGKTVQLLTEFSQHSPSNQGSLMHLTEAPDLRSS